MAQETPVGTGIVLPSLLFLKKGLLQGGPTKGDGDRATQDISKKEEEGERNPLEGGELPGREGGGVQG